MRLRKQRQAPAPAQEATKPPWQKFLEDEERPSREDRAADHNPFESVIEPVPLPRWLRGHRRAPRDKMS